MATRVFPALLLGPTFDEAQVGVGSRDLEIQVKVAR